jgi:hypothetical protein
MPADGGALMFTTEEKLSFLEKEPNALPWFRRIVGSREYINNIERWCLWLNDIEPHILKKLPLVLDRVAKVKQVRKASARPTWQTFLIYLPRLHNQRKVITSSYPVYPLIE